MAVDNAPVPVAGGTRGHRDPGGRCLRPDRPTALRPGLLPGQGPALGARPDRDPTHHRRAGQRSVRAAGLRAAQLRGLARRARTVAAVTADGRPCCAPGCAPAARRAERARPADLDGAAPRLLRHRPAAPGVRRARATCGWSTARRAAPGWSRSPRPAPRWSTCPGISGRAVKAFLVSRAGTRLVARCGLGGRVRQGRAGCARHRRPRCAARAVPWSGPCRPSTARAVRDWATWSAWPGGRPNDVAVLGHADRRTAPGSRWSASTARPVTRARPSPDTWPGSALGPGRRAGPQRDALPGHRRRAGCAPSTPRACGAVPGVGAGQVAPAYVG